MRRVGPKGEGRFERISWDDALDEIAARFQAIVAEHGAEAILPVQLPRHPGILNGLNVGDPFFHRLGATVSERTFCDSGSCTAYIDDASARPRASTRRASCTRATSSSGRATCMSTNLHLWPFIAEAQQRGAKVVVDRPAAARAPRERADWHIPIRPGTDAALALGDDARDHRARV